MLLPSSSPPNRTDDQVAGLLREASACVNSARKSLLQPAPATLREAAPLLERAIGSLENLNQLLRSHAGSRNPQWLDSAAELHRCVVQLGALLESAGGF